jgi:hypothetical protein
MRYQSLIFKTAAGARIAGMHDFSSREEMIAQAKHYAAYYRSTITVEKHGRKLFEASPVPTEAEKDAVIRQALSRLFPNVAFNA